MPAMPLRWLRRVLLPGALFAIGVGAGVWGAMSLVHPGAAGSRRADGQVAGAQWRPVPAPPSRSRVADDWDVAQPGEPTRIEIPRIGVRSGLVRLGLQADGSLQAPREWDKAGWYAGGSSPGQVDSIPAVIAGHVDSRTGPAVFFRLHELRKGDQVIVHRGDGVVASFTVDAARSYPKLAFPDAEVYGPVGGGAPQLRLITCVGSFDSSAGRYRDDLVVFAHRTG